MKIKLNLRARNAADIVNLAQTVHSRLSGNPTFPDPNPPLTDLGAGLAAAKTAMAAYHQALQLADVRRIERDTALETLADLIQNLSVYVEFISGGDEAKILGSGFAVRAVRAPLGVLAAPPRLVAKAGDNAGEVKASWKPVRGAGTYEVQTTADPNAPDSWVHRTSTTRARVKLVELPGGGRCWVRTRAIGAAGPGAWSDPAVTTVP